MKRSWLALTVLASVLLVVVSLSAPASAGSVSDERPDYVSCSFDENKLQQYQPELGISHLDVQPQNLFATYCASTERDTDVAVYMAYYPVQSGVSGEDSHRLDREPIYVFIDSSTGDVASVDYSAYHYIREETTDPKLNGTHVQMHVVRPHHQYVHTSVDGQFVPLRDFESVHQEWYDNGWSADVEATANPWTIKGKSSWWGDSSTLDYQAAEWYWTLKLQIQKLNPWSDVTSDLL